MDVRQSEFVLTNGVVPDTAMTVVIPGEGEVVAIIDVDASAAVVVVVVAVVT